VCSEQERQLKFTGKKVTQENERWGGDVEQVVAKCEFVENVIEWFFKQYKKANLN
jgi:hypothetical protein